MRIDERGVISGNRTIYIGIVITAAIYKDAVLRGKPFELRQPLPVILQSSMDEDDRTTGSFFNVIQFDVAAVAVIVLQGAVRELRFDPPFHSRLWASPMSRCRW